jgi:23S rRNA pseudouridine1911/1915/1917 synthase
MYTKKERFFPMITKTITPGRAINIVVSHLTERMRIDIFLASYFTCYSRSFFKNCIKDSLVQKNDTTVTKDSIMIQPYDRITITFPKERNRENIQQEAQLLEPDIEKIGKKITIVYTHDDFFIINKPARLTVHAPSVKSMLFTLSDWLTLTFKELTTVGSPDRPGIVHRLDKDTTGLMIIPRNNSAHEEFSRMFKNRCITKIYTAVVMGKPKERDDITLPIARHPMNRNQMTHLIPTGRPAHTAYRVLQYLVDAALLEIQLFTGRTHQIRVHCAAIEHPVFGDPIYGHKSKIIARQALHASKINFEWKSQRYTFEAPLPQDMLDLIKQLTPPDEQL